MNRITHFRRCAQALLFVFFLFPACSSATDATPHVVIRPQSGNPIHVSVEVADTQDKRQFGLMYRNELPEFSGMLFIFPHERVLSFWMKNTPLPLDIIYINTDFKVVHIAANTTPYSTAQIPSLLPAKYVLEVNGGFCQKKGVAAGDSVELLNVSSRLLSS